MFKGLRRKNWQKTMILITNNKGQNKEVSEAIVKKFSGTTFKRWRVFAVAPEKIDKAEHTFIYNPSEYGEKIPSTVMA
jgi:hypothetical protein